MARGRAPCCDKNNVNRGPWSPAEDLKLITFIQMHGHDNWRSLPRQAGLRRCGKSCRLRWVNYLSPDVKRGNFSREEEDNVIRLHQAIGNKWSKIASHLPGRTDNEIKNVWNTHLKKRLARKVIEDSSKETSVITSSSSSSATAESNFKHQKSEIESQMKLLAHEDNKKETAGTGFTEMAVAPSTQDAMMNQVTKVNHREPVNKFNLISEQSEKLLNSSGKNQSEKFTIWEDPSLLESVLNEVDDFNWPAPEKTQIGSTGNNSSCVLLTEADFDFDFDFWSMLDDDVIPAPAKADQREADNAHNMETPMRQNRYAPYEYTDENDINNMIKYLEKEAGLTPPFVGVFEMQKQHQKNDINNSFLGAATSSEVPWNAQHECGYPMWPQLPSILSE